MIPRIHLCFVYPGNICRSPAPDGLMRYLLREEGLLTVVEVGSAGLATQYLGERPDPRYLEAAQRRGIVVPTVAREFHPIDFERFDYVLAMDHDNLDVLRELAPSPSAIDRLHLLRSFDPLAVELDVPDPYHGGPQAFDELLDVCEAACRGLLHHVRIRHGLDD